MENPPNNQGRISVEGKLAELRESFRQELPVRLSGIEHLWETLCRDGVKNDCLTDMQGRLHSLVGSSGTFGAIVVSKVAQAIEQELIHLQGNAELIDEARKSIIHSLMERLHIVADSWQPDNSLYLSPPEQLKYTHEFNNLVYIIDDDFLVAQELTANLEMAGYVVRYFQHLDEFKQYCDKRNELSPGVIIMDLMFREGGIAGAAVMDDLRDKWKPMPPVIFISVRNDTEARLATVRSGGRRYLTKPLDYPKLIQTLDGLTGHLIKTPYRVLVVDDDPAMLEFYSTIFDTQGIDIRTLENPMLALNKMNEFQPELIILDIHMQHCTGLELAAMIRQDDHWSQTPIVFISSESDLGKQMVAMGLGGDDFLTKPVDGEYLIGTVLARLKRARWVGRLNKDLQEALKESQYYRIALDSHGIVSVLSPLGIFTAVNDKFCEVAGFSREELIGNTFDIVSSKYHAPEFFSELWETIAQGHIWHGVINNRSREDVYWWAETTIVPFMDEEGRPYQYVCVQTDITGLVESQQQANLARQQAEDANHAKSQFLSSMSHELRTPLNAILGFSQILTDDNDIPLNDDQAGSVKEITKAGHHLLDLINEMLDLARIEAGRVDLSIVSIPIYALFKECESLIMPILSKYKVELKPIDNACQGMTVCADYMRIKQVLLNLLSNACKYNRPGGSITIECFSLKNGQVRFEVSDTGRGIPEERLDELFKSFTRLSDDMDGIEGTGMGLVISKKLVELMGGHIGVQSEYGKGSTFWIDFPPGESVIPQD